MYKTQHRKWFILNNMTATFKNEQIMGEMIRRTKCVNRSFSLYNNKGSNLKDKSCICVVLWFRSYFHTIIFQETKNWFHLKKTKKTVSLSGHVHKYLFNWDQIFLSRSFSGVLSSQIFLAGVVGSPSAFLTHVLHLDILKSCVLPLMNPPKCRGNIWVNT